MIFAVALGYTEFVENISHHVSKLSNSRDDHFGLVEDSRTLLRRGARLEWVESHIRGLLYSKKEALLPWMVQTCASDWIAMRLQYSKMHRIEQDCSLWENAKREELKKMAMGYWKHLREQLESVFLFDHRVASMVLEFTGGCSVVAIQNPLDLTDSDFKDEDEHPEVESKVEYDLEPAFATAVACEDRRGFELVRREVEFLKLIEAKTGIIQLQCDPKSTALREASAGGREVVVKFLKIGRASCRERV